MVIGNVEFAKKIKKVEKFPVQGRRKYSIVQA
jgi:hypothetical protein